MVFKTKQVCFSKASLSWVLSLLLITSVGFWHSWVWYFKRVSMSLEEAIGLLVIFSLLAFVAAQSMLRRALFYQFPLWPLITLLVIYGLSFLIPLPSIIRAAIAFTAVFLLIYWAAFGEHPPMAFWALISLSMPVVPSLQFYLGYPARYISASLTVPLLQLNGLSVSQSGTYLVWQEQLLQFDAPCSGVTMLWAGLLLTYFIAFIYRFNLRKIIVATIVASLFVLVGNVLRASSLFYLEIGRFSMTPSWLHEGVGIVSFLGISVGIFITLTKFQLWSKARDY